MLTIGWSEGGGWEAPRIQPFQNLSLHPASSALHYSIEVRPRPRARTLLGRGGRSRDPGCVCVCVQLFEGMKAFRGVDNRVRLFRPMMNMERMHRTAQRSCLPVSLRGPAHPLEGAWPGGCWLAG